MNGGARCVFHHFFPPSCACSSVFISPVRGNLASPSSPRLPFVVCGAVSDFARNWCPGGGGWCSNVNVQIAAQRCLSPAFGESGGGSMYCVAGHSHVSPNITARPCFSLGLFFSRLALKRKFEVFLHLFFKTNKYVFFSSVSRLSVCCS